MSSYNLPKPVMTATVVRVIAVFLLLYTGADLTIPQVCGEEMNIPEFAASTSRDIRNDPAFTSFSPESKEEIPSEPTHSDEDCFCCCTHVLPGHGTPPVSVPQLNSAFAALKIIDVASPPLTGPYHPPRFA